MLLNVGWMSYIETSSSTPNNDLEKSAQKIRLSATSSATKKSIVPTVQRSHSTSLITDQRSSIVDTSTESQRKASVNKTFQQSPERAKSPERERGNDLIHREHVPPSLTKTLDHIISQVSSLSQRFYHLFLILCKQLDVITKSISIMEERLTLTEDRVSRILSSQRNNNNSVIGSAKESHFTKENNENTLNS